MIPNFVRHILGGGEPGGEDLIEDLVFGPPGGHEPLLLPQILGAVEEALDVRGRIPGEAVVGIEPAFAPFVHDLEIIAQADHGKAKLRLVVIPKAVGADLFHLELLPGVPEGQGQVFVPGVQVNGLQPVRAGLEPEEEPSRFQTEAVALGGLMPDGGFIHKQYLN